MLQHRLVAECYLGRLLESDEHVHHRDGNRHDNRWENLQVMAHAEHHAHHSQPIPLTEERVRKLLSAHTTYETARILRVHPQTLRNRFDHLLSKRRSPGGPFPRHIVEQVRAYAADPTMSTRKASALLGMSANTLRRCYQMEGIQWVEAPSGRPKSQKNKAADAQRQQ